MSSSNVVTNILVYTLVCIYKHTAQTRIKSTVQMLLYLKLAEVQEPWRPFFVCHTHTHTAGLWKSGYTTSTLQNITRSDVCRRAARAQRCGRLNTTAMMMIRVVCLQANSVLLLTQGQNVCTRSNGWDKEDTHTHQKQHTLCSEKHPTLGYRSGCWFARSNFICGHTTRVVSVCVCVIYSYDNKFDSAHSTHNLTSGHAV